MFLFMPFWAHPARGSLCFYLATQLATVMQTSTEALAYDIVSAESAQAEHSTDPQKMSMRVLFGSRKSPNNQH